MHEMHCVPQDLIDRFFPQEQPRFDLFKTHGEVRLWRSVCQRAPFEGHTVESARYHVTEGEELGFSHMRELDRAEAAFGLAVEQRRDRKAAHG